MGTWLGVVSKKRRMWQHTCCMRKYLNDKEQTIKTREYVYSRLNGYPDIRL